MTHHHRFFISAASFSGIGRQAQAAVCSLYHFALCSKVAFLGIGFCLCHSALIAISFVPALWNAVYSGTTLHQRLPGRVPPGRSCANMLQGNWCDPI